ncbi:glutathione S-transferase domain-containing protein [Colletotrichum graminicola]|uniref:Glutathione S-transferase domain-containing protein n=1 Tax=Colletotrichum graminicola (strain M1.001 / M2 / FGSC 10212) TaxID=645133 RepID=E3QUV0_COLGM|nr:glutathione S-transferase domain-containing protein [Colletotrichum graminicola M1.001]EFQ34638.1 glutathione S-transferase domain-containing protein [Colletotrichum graminicola M1.001]WDK22786.1 glutathione S-transferase domain-containing protein [Colletotrichum graminicola]
MNSHSRNLPRLNDSRASNTLWLLEELRIPYTVQTFRRAPNRLAPPELAEVHPLGKAPILEITPLTSSAVDPAGTTSASGVEPKPIQLAESGYITQYLVDHFGHRNQGLVPPRWKPGQEGRVGGETEAFARFQYLLHYVEGSFFPVIVQYLLFNVLKSRNVPFLIRPLTSSVANQIFSIVILPNAKKHLAMLEYFLKTAPGVARGNAAPFLCGPSLTAADILISFALVTAEAEGAWDAMGRWPGGSARAAHPVLFDYVDRLQREPGYLKVVDKVKEIEGME